MLHRTARRILTLPRHFGNPIRFKGTGDSIEDEQFWAVEIKAGKNLRIKAPSKFHIDLRQVALAGDGAGPARLKVSVYHDPKKPPVTTVLGTLRSGTCEQFSLSARIKFGHEADFIVEGDEKNSVFVSGLYLSNFEEIGGGPYGDNFNSQFDPSSFDESDYDLDGDDEDGEYNEEDEDDEELMGDEDDDLPPAKPSPSKNSTNKNSNNYNSKSSSDYGNKSSNNYGSKISNNYGSKSSNNYGNKSSSSNSNMGGNGGYRGGNPGGNKGDSNKSKSSFNDSYKNKSNNSNNEKFDNKSKKY